MLLTLRDKRATGAFENRVLGTFGPKRDELQWERKELHSAEIQNLWFSSNVYYSYRMKEVGEECGLRGEDCGLRVEECGLRGEECGLRGEECGLRGEECGLSGEECGLRGEECGLHGQKTNA